MIKYNYEWYADKPGRQIGRAWSLQRDLDEINSVLSAIEEKMRCGAPVKIFIEFGDATYQLPGLISAFGDTGIEDLMQWLIGHRLKIQAELQWFYQKWPELRTSVQELDNTIGKKIGEI